jgi:hypothetical protein
MPQPPDFNRIARKLIECFDPMAEPFVEDARPAIAEQLRQIWNARGAADEEAVFAELGGPTPECLRAAGAIRILDR